MAKTQIKSTSIEFMKISSNWVEKITQETDTTLIILTVACKI